MRSHRLKVLIASHACATPQNQSMFALAAAGRNWDVTLCLPSSWRDEYGNLLPAQLMPQFEARLVHFPVLRNGSVPLHVYRGRIARFLADVRPDVIYSHNEAYAASTVQWCYANRRSIRRPFGFFSCQNICKRYPVPFRQAERWVYRHSQFFFPITNAVDQVHREKGYTGPSTVLPLGYDSGVYRPQRDIANRHLRAAARPVHIAYLGRMTEEKGLITLSRALGQLRHLEWKLTLGGSGPYEQEVRCALEMAGVADRVNWPGFVARDTVPAFFDAVDLLVLPSETRPNWKEQFGRVLIEAMACGTPVIGSDSGEIPRLISETGGGLIFAEGCSTELAGALEKMLTDHQQRARLATHAAEYVVQHYSLTAIADKFADALERDVACC